MDMDGGAPANAMWGFGGVSPTGDYAVLSGGTTAGSFPQLWFLVR